MELRTFTYLDVLQPQVASFLGTVCQGFLPREGQASLYLEIAPGIAINGLTDRVLKATGVVPGMQIVERAYGVLEVHDDSHGNIRAAGDAALDFLGCGEEGRLTPRILTQQNITGVDAHHAMLINRMRHGQMLLTDQTLLVIEVHPAGYAYFVANEAEKHSPIEVLEIYGFGAFGRVFLGGGEEEIRAAASAVERSIAAVKGRPNEAAEKFV